MLKALEEKAQEFKLKYVSEAVETSPDPFLAKVILMMARYGNLYLQSAAGILQIPEESFDETLTHLLEEEIVHLNQESENLMNIEGINSYLHSNLIFGPRDLIKKENLDADTTLKAMESVAELVEFGYSKGFSFDLKLLRRLRGKAHAMLKPIREMEANYWHKILDVPEQFCSFPSFVGEENPTWEEHAGDVNHFTLGTKFSTPKEAFEVGFYDADGSPLLSKEYKYECVTAKTLPRAISIDRGENGTYKLELSNINFATNSISVYNYAPLALRKEAQEVVPKLQERLEAVL